MVEVADIVEGRVVVAGNLVEGNLVGGIPVGGILVEGNLGVDTELEQNWQWGQLIRLHLGI